MKNLPRRRPHYDVPRTSRERQFDTLYKIYYYNIFKAYFQRTTKKQKQLSLSNYS